MAFGRVEAPPVPRVGIWKTGRWIRGWTTAVCTRFIVLALWLRDSYQTCHDTTYASKTGSTSGGNILIKSILIFKNYIRFRSGKEFPTIWDFAQLSTVICLVVMIKNIILKNQRKPRVIGPGRRAIVSVDGQTHQIPSWQSMMPSNVSIGLAQYLSWCSDNRKFERMFN